jgi:RNA-directed DNA polymerase
MKLKSRAEIKGLTKRRNLSLPKDVVLNKLNEVVRGWTGYFYYQNCNEYLSALKPYLEERVWIYLRRKLAVKHRGYKAYPYGYFNNVLGLYKIPTTAPWTQTAKAFGRR